MEEQVKVEKLLTKSEHDNDSGGNIPKGKGVACRVRTSASFGPRGVQLSTGASARCCMYALLLPLGKTNAPKKVNTSQEN